MQSNAFGAHAPNTYAENARRQVPGHADLLRMTALLLGEYTPPNGLVLVVGAGGGLELKALADAHPGWTFDGVDPSAEMLRLAERTVDPHAHRIRFHEGYIGAAPEGRFDAATCLLTFHFVARDERGELLRQIRRRLKLGAPLILAHISFPQSEPERSTWIARHVAFGGADAANAESARQAIGTRLSILSPDEEEAMLGEAGFTNVSLFYAGLSFKGWVAYAA